MAVDSSKIVNNIGPDGIHFKHPACGFEIELSWAHIRELGYVVCECGLTLGDCKALVCQMDEGIIQLQRDKSHSDLERKVGIATLEETRRKLLYD